jgi:hypothetical protein
MESLVQHVRTGARGILRSSRPVARRRALPWRRALRIAAILAFALAAPAFAWRSPREPALPAGTALQDGHAAPGYTDTPMLPGGKWHVHDPARPRPPVVTPGSVSTQDEPGKPPSDAIVLFDGTDLSAWSSGGGPAKWTVENGYAEVNGTGEIETRAAFGDCQLHLEWCAPHPPAGDGQGRGNSGLFFMGRYEVQILDSFENLTYPDGQAAALYGQTPPLVNACRKPGRWQSYDLVFEAPRFENGTLVKPARITVFHNGVLVHHAQEILGATAHRAVATYSPHAPELPLKIQDHGNPVRFRNVWVRPLRGSAP